MTYRIQITSNLPTLKQKMKAILRQQKLEKLGQQEPIEPRILALEIVQDGLLMGGLLAEKNQETVHLSSLALEAELRGKGIGSQLLHFLEDWARSEQCLTITLSTRSYEAKGFYEKQGYICYSTLKDVPRRGVDKHLFIKYLD